MERNSVVILILRYTVHVTTTKKLLFLGIANIKQSGNNELCTDLIPNLNCNF